MLLFHPLIKSLVLLLLLSQFVTMAHAFEHETAHADDEHCFLCIHKNNLENSFIDKDGFLSVCSFNEERTDDSSYDYSSRLLLTYNSRSPPQATY